MIHNIFSIEQNELLKKISLNLNKQQIIWLAGYYAGLSDLNVDLQCNIDSTVVANAANEITIVYGSRTGNGEALAKMAEQKATEMGFDVCLKNMFEYKTRDLQNEKNLLVIVSTHGEGEPPFAAKEFYDFVHSKRAPKLNDLNYAVLGLGDSSYFHFCKTANDFDAQFEKLGAKRISPTVNCDVNFAETANQWISDSLQAFAGNNQQATKTAGTEAKAASELVLSTVSRSNPFNAPVLEKLALHSRNSDRQTMHLELSTNNLPELNYEPGDAVGVIPVNTVELINEVYAVTGLNAGDSVVLNGKAKKLEEALFKDLELSKITVDVVKRYLEFYPNEALSALANEPIAFKNYLDGRDVVDLFVDYPTDISAENIVKILRPLQARYYSISSSQKANPAEVHLTVAVVQYNHAGRDKKGTCSNYLSDIVMDNETVPIFIEKNPNFRLPQNVQTPIIMVGAGTGIAPYRAFVQERELAENAGKSWLFFGNRNFESEFIYQTEWQAFLKSGALTRMDVAFSRDGDKKIYVQDKLWEQGAEIYQWLEQGAHFYICGDMKNMARAVQDTLLRVVEKHGLLSQDQAQAYVSNLEKTKKLQLDVY